MVVDFSFSLFFAKNQEQEPLQCVSGQQQAEKLPHQRFFNKSSLAVLLPGIKYFPFACRFAYAEAIQLTKQQSLKIYLQEKAAAL